MGYAGSTAYRNGQILIFCENSFLENDLKEPTLIRFGLGGHSSKCVLVHSATRVCSRTPEGSWFALAKTQAMTRLGKQCLASDVLKGTSEFDVQKWIMGIHRECFCSSM